MDHINRPTKEQIRAWLTERWRKGAPLPDREQLLRELDREDGMHHLRQPDNSDRMTGLNEKACLR